MTFYTQGDMINLISGGDSGNEIALTIHLKPEVEAELLRLSQSSKRARSIIAAEAIAAYVDREISIIEGVGRGMDDMRVGRLVPHYAAMDEIDAIIAAAQTKLK